MALQATSQQIVDYKLMVQSTEASMAALRALGGEAARQNNASELAVRDKTFGEGLEGARTRNKKFLESLSERQRSGLKEIVKKLAKTDAELAQQARALDEQFEVPREAGAQLTGSVQTLEGTLTGLRSEQTELGQEMSIGEASEGNGLRISIPRVKTSVTFDNQAITITTAGMLSNAGTGSEQNTFKLELTADESDLQEHITDVLRAQLDKDDACGDRIAIRTAALTPAEPESLLVARLHYERWACFGQSTMNEMAEGNGKAILPVAPEGGIALHRAEFSDGGSGKLVVVLNGDVQLSADAVASLTNASKPGEARAGEAKSQSSSQPSGQH